MKRTLKDAAQLPKQHRTAEIEMRTVNDGTSERTTYSVAVSSESEIERWYGIEILDHAKGSVDMSRMKNGAAVLIDHNSDQIGVVDSARIDEDKVLRADLRFSKSARGQEVEQDVKDGIRRNISVGYFVKKMKLVETRDGVDVWRVTRWTPVEVSIVSVPADATVGVGRGQEAESPVEIEDGAAVREEQTMKKVRDEKGAVIEVEDTDPRPEYRAAEVTERAKPEADDKDPITIAALCEANGMSGRTSEFLSKGMTVRQVALAIVADKKTNGEAQGAESLGIPERDLSKFSYSRAILVAAGVEEGGIEAELSAELAGRMPQNATRRGGVLVPLSLGRQKRTLSSNVATKGAEAVFEERGELIELLRNLTAVVKRGATVLSGLSSPIAFPKQSAAMSATWMGENPASPVSESDIALGMALLAPKTLQAATSYSRQLLIQQSLDTEAMVTNEIAQVHAIAIDKAALHGLSAAGEPTGIYKAADVAAKAFGGVASYALAIDMQGAVALSNAISGTLGYIAHPTMATNLRKLLDFSAAAAGKAVWTGTYEDGEIGGYPATATNQVSNTMTGSEATGGAEIGFIFGNWADLIVGSFGALELVVDPYTSKKKGLIEVASFQMCDVLVRRGQSFCKSTGATG